MFGLAKLLPCKKNDVRSFKDLMVYKKAYKLAMEIYQISKRLPVDERYSLTDQVRRSSRSVCANLAEGFRRKKYPPHFLSRIADCDAENSETGVWIDFALSCQYITEQEHQNLVSKQTEVGKLLGDIIKYPEKYR